MMSEKSELFKKLKTFSKRNFGLDIFTGLLRILIINISLFILLTLLEMLFGFSAPVRTAFIIVIFLNIILSLIIFFINPLFRFIMLPEEQHFINSSEIIGKYFSQIKDKLKNILQLYFNNDNSFYSKELIDAGLDKIEKNTINIDFNKAINRKKIKFPSLIFLIVLFFLSTLFIASDNFSLAAYRLINFNKEFQRIADVEFIVLPGNVKINKGDNLNIKITLKGKQYNKIFLNYGESNQETFEKTELFPDSVKTYNYRFTNLQKDITYFLSAGENQSERYNILVISYPLIKNLKLSVIPPAYSKLETEISDDNGDINTLKGSSALLKISSSKPLKNAYLLFDDSSRIQLKVNNQIAEGQFVCRRSGSYKIIIIDEDGNTNLNPVDYRINLNEDLSPQIAILKPEDNLVLSEKLLTQTLVRVKDDFGFSGLKLFYRLSYSKYEQPHENFSSINLPLPAENDALVNYLWELSGLNLVSEDVVSYYFEVKDNDTFSGPKSAKSPVQTIRVASLDEILADTKELNEKTETDIQKILKESEELKKDLAELDKDLKSAKDKLSWEEQKKVENIINKQQNIQNKVNEIEKNISEIQKNLTKNNILSKETLEKYLQLQELFNELSSEEMRKAIEKLNETLKNLSKQNLQNAMKDFKINEEMFRASIERTLNLFKRIQIEQKIDELMKRIDNAAQMQQDINDQLSKTNPDNKAEMDKLSKKQDEISKELEKMKKDLADLEEKMSEFPKEMPLKEMSDLKEEFEKEDADSDSQEASENLSKGDKSSAMKSQSSVKQKMNKMKNSLMGIKNKMMQNQMKMALNKMKSIINDLLELSRNQEKLKNNTQKLQPSSPQVNKAKVDQLDNTEDLQKLLQQLSELSQKSFVVTPEMGKELGDALNSMNEALFLLEQNNTMGAGQSQKNAMSSLNKASQLMNNMLQEMMQGGQGGGMMSFMKQMEKLSGMQMDINQLTQQLANGQLSMGQMAQLQRLAAQQQAVQKSLEQLNREIKESSQGSKMLGDLEDAIKKMEEVITEMKQNKISNELIQKQERILTRMLDAQRSMNERDFEKKRKSNPGRDNLVNTSPAELNLNDQQNNRRLDLLKTLEEGYSRDYEILIKKYFEEIRKKIK